MAGVVNCIPFLRKNSSKGQEALPPSPPRLQRSASSSSKATTLRRDLAEKSSFRNGSAPPSRSGTPLGSPSSIPPGFGWGKIIEEGKNLSVSTLGSYKGAGGSTLSVDTELDFRPKRISTTERLAGLRRAMADEPDGGLDYYIVPSEDAHQSEITADADKRREFISGFTGSAGVAIICRRESEGAHLFTDSRYYLQALRELDSNWSLHRVGLKGIKTWQEWLIDRSNGSRTGIDSRHISHETATSLQALLTSRSSRLCYPRLNLIDGIWKDRPLKERKPIFIQEIEFAGRSVKDKLSDLRVWIRSRQPPGSSSSRVTSPASSRSQTPKPSPPPRQAPAPVGTLLSNLGQIAYILNIRGADVPYNPVILSYLFVSLTSAVLFVDRKKIDEKVAKYFADNDIETREINDVWSFLRRADWGPGKILIDSKTPYAVALMLTSTRYALYPSPAFVEQYKAIKNDIEIKGFRNAYLRDGAAMVRFFAWLDEKMRNNEQVTEWGAAQRLSDFRRQGDYFVCLAYENISATGGNAALPHYSPTRGTASFINTSTPYLNDSGGNYLDGTCDTTRTVHYGQPKQEQMEAFTRVLQGHIAIDSAIFPEGTTGQQLDVLARKSLWKDGLNYLHGTGHGFGSFLNVHEGPHGFSSSFPLVPGHVITNEPGFYKDNEFGIRIESALLIKKVETKGKFGGGDWYGFERFTQVPIQTRMIKWEMLNQEEKDWLRNHNLQCLEKLSPLLQTDKRALKWLKRECTRSSSSGSAAGVNVEWD